MWKPTSQIHAFHHDLSYFTPQNSKTKANLPQTANILIPLCALVSPVPLAPSDVVALKACLGGG